MGQRRLSHENPTSKRNPPGRADNEDRARELRTILRVDLVIYTVVGVVCILALASLHPAIHVDPAVIGTLITFATGLVGGLFAYLRYKARNGQGEDQ